ncbi:hypothetical protein JOC78_002771 [Bacillus ectoiniformans]|uniref:hypothetical protein n=1 Tax=Bacillus ectoiniformans TaxID=1494429 RepID=UPI001959066E|nr:hypothetical protein [Bacillus ectoiniformans]MBM7649787.1 hypothetical protein [Bacillus ectoiniformans]
MSKDQQEIIDVLNYNRSESEQLLVEAKSKAETHSNSATESMAASERSIDSADEVIQRSLQLLSSRGVSIDLPKNQKKAKIPKPARHSNEGREWNDLVKEAGKEGFINTNIDDLLTPQEIAEADSEYIRVKKAFSKKTSLNKSDIALLLLTIALQCARQYIFANDQFRFQTAKDADDTIKAPLKKMAPDEWKDFLFGPVPYDAVARLDPQSENTGLSANTHRYRTLGHDPVLGWIFGPVNILSYSLTKTDMVTTYEVTGGKIGPLYNGLTLGAMQSAIRKASEGKHNLPAAVVKQAIHFGSDYFTKQGLPLPLIGSLNNDLAQKLIHQYSIDTYSVTRGATISMFINTIIGLIHRLFYNEEKHGSKELYEVRTRKILLIANSIATSSNVIYVALSRDVKKLDVGGMLVTIKRMINHLSFINHIQQEFMLEIFDKDMEQELAFLDGELQRLGYDNKRNTPLTY